MDSICNLHFGNKYQHKCKTAELERVSVQTLMCNLNRFTTEAIIKCQ